MTRNPQFTTLGIAILLSTSIFKVGFAAPGASGEQQPATEAPAEPIEFFEAVDGGQVKAQIIVKNDHDARIILTNNTTQPVKLKLPEAFAAVPALAQFGGGNQGGGGRTTGGGGGGQQSTGGGLGGGQQGGGGGGGVFSIPPEQTKKMNVEVLCLDHGLRDPSSATEYKIVPADEHVDRPEVVELLKAFGRGDLDHHAAQAATWHLNNDLSWNDLAAKLQGTRRSLSRPPYFTKDELKAAVAYADEAKRLAVVNADKNAQEKKEREERRAKARSSDANRASDFEANEPVKDEAKADSGASDESSSTSTDDATTSES